MQVFCNLHVIDFYMDAVVCDFLQQSSGITNYCNRRSANAFCVFHRVDHVSGIAGTGNSDKNVFRRHFIPQRKSKNLIIRNIVCDCHHSRDIVIQTFKMIFPILCFADAFVEITAVVAGSCRAASVAADKNVPVGEPCFFQQIHDGIDSIKIEGLDDFYFLIKICLQLLSVIHRSVPFRSLLRHIWKDRL